MNVEYGPPNPALDPLLNSISGRYIIDGQHFLRSIRSLEIHRERCLKSSRGWFKLIRSRTRALFWYLDFECPYCKECQTVTNEPLSVKKNEMDSHDNLTIADAAVWGVISTGSGYRQLEEILSHLGIKCMSQTTFMKLEQKMGNVSYIFVYVSFIFQKIIICFRTGKLYLQKQCCKLVEKKKCSL